jgi:hypothetical protein
MATTHRPGHAGLALTLAALLVIPAPALAQTRSNAPAPAAPRAASAAKRTAWTLIGAGVGFGAGMLLGLRKFDDARYAERKIMTTALIGAAAGGLAGNLLSKDAQPSFVPKTQPMRTEGIVLPRLAPGSDASLQPRVAAANPQAFSMGAANPAQTKDAGKHDALGALIDKMR